MNAWPAPRTIRGIFPANRRWNDLHLSRGKKSKVHCVFRTQRVRSSPMGMDSFNGCLLTSSACLNIISKIRKIIGRGLFRRYVQFWTFTKCVRNSILRASFGCYSSTRRIMWTPYLIRASFEDEAAEVMVAGHERQAIATDLTLWPNFSQNQNQTRHSL